MKYFSVERNNECLDGVILRDKDGNIAFEDLMNMSYEEMTNYSDIESFVVSVMDATNMFTNSEDADTAVTLIGEDDVFIWGIIISPTGFNDEFHYVFVDWKKYGKNYKYEN